MGEKGKEKLSPKEQEFKDLQERAKKLGIDITDMTTKALKEVIREKGEETEKEEKGEGEGEEEGRGKREGQREKGKKAGIEYENIKKELVGDQVSEIYKKAEYYNEERFKIPDKVLEIADKEIENKQVLRMAELGKQILMERLKKPKNYPELKALKLKDLNDSQRVLDILREDKKFQDTLEKDGEFVRLGVVRDIAKESLTDSERILSYREKSLIFCEVPKESNIREILLQKLKGRTGEELNEEIIKQANMEEKGEWVENEMAKNEIKDKERYKDEKLEDIQIRERYKVIFPEEWEESLKIYRETWDNKMNKEQKERYNNSLEEYLNQKLEDEKAEMEKDIKDFKKEFEKKNWKGKIDDEDFYAILESGYNPKDINAKGLLLGKIKIKKEKPIKLKEFSKQVREKRENMVSNWRKRIGDDWEKIKIEKGEKWDEKFAENKLKFITDAEKSLKSGAKESFKKLEGEYIRRRVLEKKLRPVERKELERFEEEEEGDLDRCLGGIIEINREKKIKDKEITGEFKEDQENLMEFAVEYFGLDEEEAEKFVKELPEEKKEAYKAAYEKKGGLIDWFLDLLFSYLEK